jgi:hypothetical protein
VDPGLKNYQQKSKEISYCEVLDNLLAWQQASPVV